MKKPTFMKALKVIALIVIGFVLGISYMPIKSWYYERKHANEVSFSTCDTRPKEEIIPLVKQGDTLAYNELWTYFSCQDNPEGLLPYALLMANKYHYKKAVYDVYNCLWYIYRERASNRLSLLDSLDEVTRNTALQYLQKAAELGERNAMNKLGKYYYEGKYFEQDTVLGKEMMENAFKVK